MLHIYILSGDIQVNPGPNSNLCDSWLIAENWFFVVFNAMWKYIKNNMICNNMRMFENGLCNKCKTYVIVNRNFSTLSENLPFHQVINKETDHSITSSNIKTPKQTFTETDPDWKVFKNKGLHFRYLNINSILPKIEQLRSLLINWNISVLGITETKLDNTVSNEEVEIDGYNLIRSDRNRNGGGIACYVKTSITSGFYPNTFLDSCFFPKIEFL